MSRLDKLRGFYGDDEAKRRAEIAEQAVTMRRARDQQISRAAIEQMQIRYPASTYKGYSLTRGTNEPSIERQKQLIDTYGHGSYFDRAMAGIDAIQPGEVGPTSHVSDSICPKCGAYWACGCDA